MRFIQKSSAGEAEDGDPASDQEGINGQNMFMKTVIEADDRQVIPVLTMGPSASRLR